jgi:hypothetical protein
MRIKPQIKILGSPSLNGHLNRSFSNIKRRMVKKDHPKVPPLTREKTNQGQVPGTINSDFGLMIPIFSRLTKISEKELEGHFNKTVEVHNKLIMNLGVRYGTKHFKDIVLYCVLLIEGRDPPKVNRVSTGKVDGWPNIFGFLRPIYHSITPNRKGVVVDSKEICVEKLRLLQTLFKLNRICSSYAELDVSNIQSTFELPKDFVSEYETYLEDKYGVSDPINPDDFKIRGFLGSKRGPNNVPKIESAGAEAAKLYASPEHKHFYTLCSLTDNMPFYEYFLASAEKFKKDNPNDDLSKIKLRKLVAVPDTGNKSRTIAIVDVWTQMVLEPFEEYLKQQMLRQFPTASAYLSHSGGFNKLKNTLRDDYVSIDASQWTDNFPSHIQYLTVKKLLGQEYATAWQALAIKCKWNVGNSDHTIKYGKGQGMGTKGSFMAASYSDHDVIEFTYFRHYGKILEYQKVGDDLVAQDPNNIFVEMYNSIGVPINVSKSKKLTPRGHFLEFVSRNLWDGMDYSILSPRVLTKALKQPYVYPVLVSHLAERIRLDAIPSLEEIFKITPPGANPTKSEEHKCSIKKLLGIYASLTGVDLIKIENPEVYRNTRKLLLAIIQEILKLHNEYANKAYSQDSVAKCEDWVSEFVNNEYSDRWEYFVDKSLSLNEIELFNFSLQVFTEMQDIEMVALSEGRIYSVPEEPHPNQYTLPGSSPPYRLAVTMLLLQCLMVVKCKVENIQIIHSLDSLHPKNSEPTVHLLKSLNTCVKRSECKNFDESLSPKDKMILSTLNLNNIYTKIQRSVGDDTVTTQSG